MANVEANAIETAYAAQVETLFRTLIINLGDEPVSHQTDQQNVDKFVAGLDVARRARQLALNVVSSSSTGVRPSRARKKS